MRVSHTSGGNGRSWDGPQGEPRAKCTMKKVSVRTAKTMAIDAASRRTSHTAT